jgi:hypothetical protein
MMIKYFSANIEDAARIARVEAENEDDIRAAGFESVDELTAGELPDDFAIWKRYTAYAKGSTVVEVMSQDGD